MKPIGEKVLGWFIVQEEEDGGTPVPAAPTAPPAPAAPRATPAKRPLEPETLGALDLPATSFADVYRRAGIAEAEHERLGKTLELVAALPLEATPAVKRTIVEAALQAFAVPIDRILQTADAALGALDKHVADGEARTAAARASTDEQIKKLTTEIDRLHRVADAQSASQEALVQTAARERSRVMSVIHFFRTR